MRALGRGVAAPDEAGGFHFVLLPDLRGGALRDAALASGRRGGGVLLAGRAYLSGVPRARGDGVWGGLGRASSL